MNASRLALVVLLALLATAPFAGATEPATASTVRCSGGTPLQFGPLGTQLPFACVEAFAELRNFGCRPEGLNVRCSYDLLWNATGFGATPGALVSWNVTLDQPNGTVGGCVSLGGPCGGGGGFVRDVALAPGQVHVVTARVHAIADHLWVRTHAWANVTLVLRG